MKMYKFLIAICLIGCSGSPAVDCSVNNVGGGSSNPCVTGGTGSIIPTSTITSVALGTQFTCA